MGVEERFRDDLKTAMRGGDTLRRDAIRFALSALNYEEKAKLQALEEEEKVAVLQRQAKRHRESIEEFNKGNRQDLVDKEEAELHILREYMPAQLSQEELADLAKGVIEEVGATGPTDKGKVMGRLMPQVRGKAEGSMVNEVVTKLLAELEG